MWKKDLDRPDIFTCEEPQKLLWVPEAIIPDLKMVTRGRYRNGYPEGAIVHFTAGSSAISSMNHGRESGFCFFVLDEYGKLYQSFPLNMWGSHAGESFWQGLGSGVSRYLVGVEVSCAGRLEKVGDKFKAWFHKKPEQYFDETQVRWSDKNSGWYHRFTVDQERELTDLLVWLYRNNPEVFKIDLILGHEEVSPGRKDDPGGSLSMSMEELRKVIKKQCLS